MTGYRPTGRQRKMSTLLCSTLLLSNTALQATRDRQTGDRQETDTRAMGMGGDVVPSLSRGGRQVGDLIFTTFRAGHNSTSQ